MASGIPKAKPKYMKYPMMEAISMAFWSSIPLSMKMKRGNRKNTKKLVKRGKFTPMYMMLSGENGDSVNGDGASIFWNTFYTLG